MNENRRNVISHLFKKDDKIRSLLSQKLMEYAISNFLTIPVSQLVFEFNKYGKPELLSHSNVFFNISHCGNWLVCIVENDPVGVDIEKLVGYTTDTIDIFCSSKEKELLHLSGDPKNLYYKFWTLKAIGTGLFRDPKDVEVSFINEHQSRIILDKSYWLGRSIVINDEYVLSSVSSSSLEYHKYINISADTFYYESIS
ncbi:MULTISPECIES: 4'-phosphopantetheinyl transferase superfamily protein [Leuconostoc]|uniref:4'-phosphopantetheinyl transferase family protein n=1 Tax=Leuconostoc sp. (strain C2) TaxID=979982 RepID=UPI001F6045D1|nr:MULTISPECIES: 4'-phosphopantetheinyl transferase superfamily protein [Leuconostoc]